MRSVRWRSHANGAMYDCANSAKHFGEYWKREETHERSAQLIRVILSIGESGMANPSLSQFPQTFPGRMLWTELCDLTCELTQEKANSGQTLSQQWTPQSVCLVSPYTLFYLPKHSSSSLVSQWCQYKVDNFNMPESKRSVYQSKRANNQKSKHIFNGGRANTLAKGNRPSHPA
jgi:hypothetical protein